MKARWVLCALALTGIAACGRGSNSTSSDASTGEGPRNTSDRLAIARAEDARKSKDVPPAVRTSHDVSLRRRSARAFARIGDPASVDGLVQYLADEDAETVAWAAYGLGYACKGREDAHVRMLAARAASLPATPSGAALDPQVAIARAVGRCATPLAEQVLIAMLAVGSEGALLGLGDLATRRRELGADAMTALLDRVRGGTSDLAFYALSRAEPGETFGKRVAAVARLALARPSEARILAIRALGRTGKESAKEIAAELGHVVTDPKGFDPGERAEAARALGALGPPGHAALFAAVTALTPDAHVGVGIGGDVGSPFVVLHTVLGQLPADGSGDVRSAEASLDVLASLAAPTEPTPALARRLAELRCGAALALARGAYDADILRKCDAETSESSQTARLSALLRRPLTKDRLAAFRSFAKSEHLRVRERAVEALGSHPEIGEAGVAIVADALASKHAGLVATAAEMVNAHPERALVLAESEKRAALDPKAPPPTAEPAQEIAPAVARALTAALAEGWPEDRFETRIALIEAAGTLRLPKAKEIAGAACNDANPTVRERALKVLRALGATVTACDAPDRDVKGAPELGATLAKPTKLLFSTDVGARELGIVLEPELSPITATRLVALARSGFYKGVEVHRVVPGFVVQLGDPEGDGYGGAGTPLRCETSPAAFKPLDVGMALAGRDTGSSQFFVTLSRTPHLDGEYTRVGHAEGDWASVAQGDVIRDVRVVE